MGSKIVVACYGRQRMLKKMKRFSLSGASVAID